MDVADPGPGGEEGAAGREPDRAARPRADAFQLYALTRTRAFRGPLPAGQKEVSRIRYRDLEALVRAAPFRVPDLEAPLLAEHQRVVEVAMRRVTVFPVPYGIVFRDRRELIRWMEDQYLMLDEALSFLEGHWELRVHLGFRSGAEVTGDLRELAGHMYAELRRSAHAAMPLAAGDSRVLSAAFLVHRGAWVEFVERAEDVVATEPRLTLDVTGPWAAYDFVRLTR